MTVYLAGDDIRCRGPRGAVPTDLLARLRALKAEIAAELRVADCGTIARPAAPPPDPVDIAEAAAIRAGAAGLTAREADTRVLREHGFNGWPAYAGEWRRHILDELAVLPPTCSIDAVRLKRATQAFVMSTDLDTAMSCGWSVPALVGVRAPFDGWHVAGIVCLAAMADPPARITAFAPDRVCFTNKCGTEAMRGRFAVADLEASEPWWRCGWLVHQD